MIYKNIFKPIFDRSLAFIALIIFLPIMVVVGIIIWLFVDKEVIFTQARPGKDGKIFTLYKFKTMSDERDENGNLLPDEKRLKGVGKKIRSLSLDELPQLFNVLKGDMSLIGPRPLLVEYLPLYNSFQARRHEVKPGITGWAQVNGRNAISWEDRFKYDVWYVDHISFALDMKILWLTLKKVLVKEGISAKGEATMTKFQGTKE